MSSSQPLGKIITFYSYKGGTGRSMAVANIAWILACAGRSVLVLDWDLEAPGLHRYFRPFLIDKELSSSEGIIDYIIAFCDEAIRPVPEGEEPPDDWYVKFADISRYRISLNYEDFPHGGKIDFVPAGQQGSSYAARVNSFNWQDFYQRLGGGAFIEATREEMRKRYDYILVDSRTGVSDTAGICTVQLPDTLAIFFTFNNQSITGAAAVAQSVFDQRKDTIHGAHRFRILPVPTRVDQTERDKLDQRKVFARFSFDTFLDQIPPTERGNYWDNVEVPYVPWFAYEEVLSPFRDSAGDPKTVLASMKRITDFLVQPEIENFAFEPLLSPEQKQRILSEFAATPIQPQEEAETSLPTETPLERAIRLAERCFLALTNDERNAARRLWLRLVRVPRPGERIENSKVRVLAQDLSDIPAGVINRFTSVGLLVKGLDDKTNEPIVEVVNEELLRNWKRLLEWIDEDRDFLLWRQVLQNRIAEWKAGSPNAALLEGNELATAQVWWVGYKRELNEAEQRYVELSIEKDRQKKKRLRLIAVTAVPLVLIAIGLVFGIRGCLGYRQRVDLAKRLSLQAEQIMGSSALLAGKARVDQIQLATLLEIEADRLSTTSETKARITKNLSLLPRRISNSPQEREIQRVAISENGDRVVAILGRTLGDSDIVEEKIAVVQETSTGRQLSVLRFSASSKGLVISRDGKLVVTYPSDSYPKPSAPIQPVTVWDKEGSSSVTIPSEGQNQRAFISPDNKFLVLMTYKQGLKGFDLDLTLMNRFAVRESRLTSRDLMLFLGFNAGGDYALMRTESEVIVKPLRNREPSGEGPPPIYRTISAPYVSAGALSPSAKLTAFTIYGSVEIWDTTTGKRLGFLSGMRATSRSSLDGTIQLYFTPDEKTLIATGDELITWDVESKREKLRISDSDFDRAIVASDGACFAAINNNVARIFSYSAGSFVETGLIFLDGPINDLAFGRENTVVVAGGSDKSLLIWDLRSPPPAKPDPVDYCMRLTRNLSPEEWIKYMRGQTYHQACPSTPVTTELKR